jgi:hypothetical protein
MMRVAIILWMGLAMSSAIASADDADTASADKKAEDIPDFDKIRTLDSPAFTLLGVSPSAIDRPTTPKQLTASLGGFLAEGGVAIPKNLAVEFSPYWLISHPTVTAEAYQGRGTLMQFLQNITISIGTSTAVRGDEMAAMTTADAHTDSSLAAGARTFFDITAKPVACTKADIEELRKLAGSTTVTDGPEGLAINARLALAGQEKELADRELAAKFSKLDEDERRTTRVAVDIIKDRGAIAVGIERAKKAADVIVGLNEEYKSLKVTRVRAMKEKLAKVCTDGSETARQGLVAELAVAASELFLDGSTSDHHYGNGAIWATLAYERPGWTGLAVARGRSLKVTGSERDRFFETGLRLIRSKDSYAASIELMMRAPTTTYRVAAALDYHLQDNTWLTFSFGRDFASGEGGSLFSLANIKFGIGDPEIVPPQGK